LCSLYLGQTGSGSSAKEARRELGLLEDVFTFSFFRRVAGSGFSQLPFLQSRKNIEGKGPFVSNDPFDRDNCSRRGMQTGL